MKKHGILMTPENALKCYLGTKGVTRRLMKWRPIGVASVTKHNNGWLFLDDEGRVICRMTPKYSVGAIVAIKEYHWRWGRKEKNPAGNWRLRCIQPTNVPEIIFQPPDIRVDKECDGYHGVSGLFLPFDLARTHWEIVDVRPERLQECNEAEACLEGYPGFTACGMSAVVWMMQLWDSINPDHPWVDNDWVWRYKGRKVTTCLQR